MLSYKYSVFIIKLYYYKKTHFLLVTNASSQQKELENEKKFGRIGPLTNIVRKMPIRPEKLSVKDSFLMFVHNFSNLFTFVSLVRKNVKNFESF